MSHTCFNQLVLPSYRSKKTMKQKLMIAIQNAEGFGLEWTPGGSMRHQPPSLMHSSIFTSSIISCQCLTYIHVLILQLARTHTYILHHRLNFLHLRGICNVYRLWGAVVAEWIEPSTCNAGFLLTPKRTFLPPWKMLKTSKSFSVIAVSNGLCPEFYVRLYVPSFWTLMEAQEKGVGSSIHSGSCWAGTFS